MADTLSSPGPTVTRASTPRDMRLRRYLAVNLVGLWGTVLSLTVTRVTVIDSATMFWTIVVLTIGALAMTLGYVLAQRGRTRASAIVVILAGWGISAAITWISPFILPVALIALLLPVVMVIDYLPHSLRTPAMATTTVLTGVIAGIGERRRFSFDVMELEPDLAAILVALFSAMVSGLVLLGLWQRMRRLTEQADELRRSRSRLVTASMEARRAIERDLHDGAQQRLAGLAGDLGRASRLIERDPVAGRMALTELQAQLQQAIKELRDLARGIYPAVLTEGGLSVALPEVGRRTALPCSVDVRRAGRHIPEVEAAVYFCCTEAIHNADRHSGATHIDVAVWGGADDPFGMHFMVRDDGAGLPDGLGGTSSGLQGMRDRIRAAGGELSITGPRGRGTRVSGHFPPTETPDGRPGRGGRFTA